MKIGQNGSVLMKPLIGFLGVFMLFASLSYEAIARDWSESLSCKAAALKASKTFLKDKYANSTDVYKFHRTKRVYSRTILEAIRGVGRSRGDGYMDMNYVVVTRFEALGNLWEGAITCRVLRAPRDPVCKSFCGSFTSVDIIYNEESSEP